MTRRRSGKAEVLRLSRTLGPHVVAWMEANLCCGPGDVAGQPLILDDEEVRFVMRAYAIDDRGRRVVRRSVYSRPKGRRKSEIAAALSCAELLGPVRFRGWDHDGMPLAGQVRTPIVLHAATEEGQAGNSYGAAEFMLREGAVSRTPGLDVGQTRTLLSAGGKMQPVTARASSKDGGKETFVVFDETHLYVSPELKRLAETIRRNLTKRKQAEPWSLETSTMYAPGEGSVAEASHAYALAVLEGRVTDPGFLFDHRQGPAEFDFDDDDQLRAALMEAYGEAAEWIDFERMIADARDPQTDRSDFMRYFVNVATEKVAAKWLLPSEWDARAASVAVAEGTTIGLGFDGSDSDDATVLVGCTIPARGERPHLFTLGVWERPEGAAGEGWRVPRWEVEAEVARAFQRFRVARLIGDPARWEREFGEWEATYGDDVVVRRPGTQRARNVESYSLLRIAVRGGGRLERGGDGEGVDVGEVTHDGHPAIARHVRNAKVRATPVGDLIEKDHPGSPRKIDGAVAAAFAHEAATVAVEGSPYRDRGLLVLGDPLPADVDDPVAVALDLDAQIAADLAAELAALGEDD